MHTVIDTFSAITNIHVYTLPELMKLCRFYTYVFHPVRWTVYKIIVRQLSMSKYYFKNSFGIYDII